MDVDNEAQTKDVKDEGSTPLPDNNDEGKKEDVPKEEPKEAAQAGDAEPKSGANAPKDTVVTNQTGVGAETEADLTTPPANGDLNEHKDTTSTAEDHSPDQEGVILPKSEVYAVSIESVAGAVANSGANLAAPPSNGDLNEDKGITSGAEKPLPEKEEVKMRKTEGEAVSDKIEAVAVADLPDSSLSKGDAMSEDPTNEDDDDITGRPSRALRKRPEPKELPVKPETTPKRVKKEEEAPKVVISGDTYVGRIIEKNKMNKSGMVQALIGTVHEYREQDRRIPPRWAVHWPDPEVNNENVVLEEEWIESDFANPYSEDGSNAATESLQYHDMPQPPLDAIQQRYDNVVVHELEQEKNENTENLIPSLVLLAALEESLQTLLEQQSLQAPEPESSKPSRRQKKSDKSRSHPPLYYTSNPSQYLQPPSLPAYDSSSANKSINSAAVVVTPANLSQRVRSGCQWAWEYLAAQQPIATPPQTLVATNQRRSLRQPKPAEAPFVPMPVPVRRGGRVAMWWLEELKRQQEAALREQESIAEAAKMQPPEEKEQKGEGHAKDRALEKKPTTNSSPEPDANADNVDMDIDDEEDDDDEADAKTDDDAYNPNDDTEDDPDEDEELQDVEKERGKLSPVPPPTKTRGDDEEEESSEEEEEAEEEEVNEDYEIEFNNPYLRPSFASYLEYLARPKSLTAAEIQAALCECLLKVRFSKRTVEFGIPVSSLASFDQLVMERASPDYPSSGQVVLECVSGETFAELKRLDPQVFSRCKFTLTVLGEHEVSQKVMHEQEFLIKEAEYKQQKVWDKWRFKGMHEGFAIWPSWDDAIREWYKKSFRDDSGADPIAPTDDTAAAATTLPEAQDESSDLALAKSLEEAESSGRRRTARRAATFGAGEGFYGGQSQMNQKDLMGALVRLVKGNQVQTLTRLQSLVGDDSTNPLRRARIALGKLVWKRNQLARKSATTELSDSSLTQLLARKPLVEIKRLETNVASETAKEAIDNQMEEPSNDRAEEKMLVDYLQSLHQTELKLRGLVLKHLSEIPIAIIATAADERLGSMESMDEVDFEDPSTVEWHSSGHNLLGQVIYRPSETSNTTDTTPCTWYRTVEFSKSVASTSEEKKESTGNDAVVVERRMRFRAVPTPSPLSDAETEVEYAERDIMILTEAQVLAGMKASKMEQEQATRNASDGHPFMDGIGAQVTLIPFESDSPDEAEISGQIVGHDTIVEDDDDVEYRILIVPSREEESRQEAFWATLDVRADDSTLLCQPVDDDSTCVYTIEQDDYHEGSPAFQECRRIVDSLRRMPKAAPFLEPVDPVALNVPTYPQIVKNPMDISTLSDKLENGNYSRIPSGQTVGKTPISRMLNGPFRKDVELIFDNATLFNPPDDWIHQAALQLKKNVLKKIADASYTADHKQSMTGRRWRAPKKSVYVDEDSDVDMYEYESDQDDDFDAGGRRSRKRKRGKGKKAGNKDDQASRAIEHPIRLHSIMRDALDLRGPLANLPVNSDASSFSMPPGWSCRRSSAVLTEGDSKIEEEAEDEEYLKRKQRAQEIAELLELHRQYEANESAGLRRSTRATVPEPASYSSPKEEGNSDLEFFSVDGEATKRDNDDGVGNDTKPPSSRLQLEIERERQHEDFYAKLYQKYSNFLVQSPAAANGGSACFGSYAQGSFPPYLGRVVPISGWSEISWEIRLPFVIPALRWVLRGLIHSGHVTAIENLDASVGSGVIMTNDVYYWDSDLKPLEVLDSKELQRRKRANKSDDEDSESDVEMSEYEKLRAERVARNAERLKALGLA